MGFANIILATFMGNVIYGNSYLSKKKGTPLGSHSLAGIPAIFQNKRGIIFFKR
jgi:hypothetical protein